MAIAIEVPAFCIHFSAIYMKEKNKNFLPFIFLLFSVFCVYSQSKKVQVLEQKIYSFNNQLKYDSSKLALTLFLQTPSRSPEDKYYAFLFLSYTYKRIFDYHTTLQYLDSARKYGAQTSTPQYFINNIACQQAYAFFDTHQYEKADSLMHILNTQAYRFLNEENKSKIIMQEAYLLYLRKAFQQAENRYKIALTKMQTSCPCDKPMIYGKLIELYGAMQNPVRMQDAYKKAVACADSCNIIKYNLYANEMMAKALEQWGQYRQANFYTHLLDSLNQVYNSHTHRNKLLEIEAKHQSEITQRQMELQRETIQSKNMLITLLLVGLVAAYLTVMLYLLRLRQGKMKLEKKNTERYTSQLLTKTEEDRKRIAGHLHDFINHELLTIKHTLSTADEEVRSRIDTLINDIRHISHNLHPVVFSRVGLAHSIKQLIERVQEKNHFMLTADVNYRDGLPSEAELQLFRIIQEAATNMIKYSNAIAGKITIMQSDDHVMVEIKDNGQGFDVATVLNSDKAFGLHNMLERSKAAGGLAQIRSDNKGTIIIIKIPLSKT